MYIYNDRILISPIYRNSHAWRRRCSYCSDRRTNTHLQFVTLGQPCVTLVMGHHWLHTQSFAPCFDTHALWPPRRGLFANLVCLLLVLVLTGGNSSLTAITVATTTGDATQSVQQPTCESTVLSEVPPEPVC